MDGWVRAHMVDVPNETRDFCGDRLAGAKVLNVGCGEMLADFGLLSLQPAHITGLDVNPLPDDWKGRMADRVRAEGHQVAADYRDRLDFVRYDGSDFPFPDDAFDFIFSWSAFEHIDDMQTVLREMRRVLKQDGRVFVQVYPWFYARDGSHLTPWIGQPWFHLTERDSWVRRRLEDHAEKHGGAEFLIGHMYREYVSLNRKTSSDFYTAARASGFTVEKAKVISYEEDLSHAPDGVNFADLMIRGTLMLMRKSEKLTMVSRKDQI